MNNFIHSFTIKNFFSFKEKSEFSFIVDKKAPQSDAYATANSGERISKVGMVVGANASGKTNLFRALGLIKKMIAVDALFMVRGEEDKLPSSPFKSFLPFLGNEKNKTELSVIFNIEKKVYEYAVSFDNLNKVISQEIFTVKDKTKERTTKKEVLSRVYDKDTQKTVVKFDKNRIQVPQSIEDTFSALPEVGIMSVLHKLDNDHAFVKEICSFWDVALPDINEVSDILSKEMGNHLAFTPFLSTISHIVRSGNIYEKYQDIKKDMEGMLEKFDTGIREVSIKKKKELDDKGKESEKTNITTRHLIDGKLFDMDFQHDSAGTKQMYFILGNLLKTKRDGGVVVIDEIDINLHPLILSEMVSVFLGEVSNKKNAQFMFSSHVHSLMGELDKYQIHIVEKDENGRSEVYRLDSVGGVRSNENYFGKYLAGAYGGIPRVR